MAVSKENTRIPITINKKLKEEIEKIAKADSRTFSNLVEKIVREWYEENKDKVQ